MANTCKYYKQQKYVSYDSGNTWSPLNEFRRGDLYEEDSADCGYEVIYKWENVIGEYTCSGCTKYQKTQKYVSYDGGTTWSAVSPAEYGIGNVIEQGSEDCGCSTQYRWVVAASEYICSGTSKYTKEYYQVSYDGGSTWQNVVPQQTRAGELIESASTDCGYIQPIYRTLSTATTCVGYDKYTLAEYQVSYDDGFSWSTTASSATTLIEAHSEDCGYVPPTPTGGTKFYATYNDSTTYTVPCDSSTTLTSSTTRAHSTSYSAMTSAVIDCVTSIGYGAFYDCCALTSVTIPYGATVIDACAFKNCCIISNISIPNSITTIGAQAFYRCPELASINIPSGVTIIQDYTFYKCTSLTNITIPNTVTRINDAAFEYCSGLTSINILDSVTYIGYDTFFGCSGMISVIIGSGITYINNDAFWNCTSLTSVTVLATTPPTLSNNTVFNHTNDCPIYVPASSVNAYKTKTMWSTYASRIQAIP